MSGTLARLGVQGPEEAEIREFLSRLEGDGIETVRFLFSDQHGLLRGKALTVSAAESACRNGVTAPSSLLLKDTSHRTAFPVWDEDAGFGPGVMTGAGDILLVPDLSTYRRLPWSPHSAWVLCEVVQSDGTAIPFAPRTVLRDALARLHDRGIDMVCGLEVEFHIFAQSGVALTHEGGGMPGSPPHTAPLNHGYQLLTDTLYSEMEDLLDEIRRAAQAMGMPVRSIEVEFGPSQVEVTFDPAPAWTHAETMVMFRALAKQVCARRGLLASFMCRPIAPNIAASGWHLHQSLVDRETGRNLFTPETDTPSATASAWIAGLLDHAAECCLITTPTVNGYKRYQPHQLAPDRIQWGRDNKGAMLRALFQPGDAASRIENRVPEPAATPHYVMAAQILSGLSGLDRALVPPAPVERPYETDAPALPANLGAAIAAFDTGELFRNHPLRSYLATLKRAEWQRYLSALSEWEQREYLSAF
ncbi:glutamine synthetase family protein [Lutimaribacter marinistellae]|uniref:Glutamine synthetase family protein n=1 Tax=Lutimaribacter marinistellae TaxID=1820329 RepID=A0ABV7TEV5_9RHOB